MPLAAPVLGGLISQNFLSSGLTGTKQLQLANAIANGLVTSILATNIYQGTGIGVGTGVGVGTGNIKVMPAPVVTASIFAMMLKNGMIGTKAIDIASAVGKAFATHIKMGIVTSTCSPVANGTGIGTLKGVTGKGLSVSIFGFMGTFGLTGTKSIDLANSIGEGVATVLKTAIVQTTIVGAGYPPTPVSGPDIGKMI